MVILVVKNLFFLQMPKYVAMPNYSYDCHLDFRKYSPRTFFFFLASNEIQHCESSGFHTRFSMQLSIRSKTRGNKNGYLEFDYLYVKNKITFNCFTRALIEVLVKSVSVNQKLTAQLNENSVEHGQLKFPNKIAKLSALFLAYAFILF